VARKLTLIITFGTMLGCASVPVQPGIQGHHPHRQADQTLLTTVIQGSVNALKVEPWAEQLKDKKVSLRIVGVPDVNRQHLAYNLENKLMAEAKVTWPT